MSAYEMMGLSTANNKKKASKGNLFPLAQIWKFNFRLA